MAVDPNELLEKGKTAFNAGKLETAKALLQQVVAWPHQAAIAHSFLAYIAMNRRDSSAATGHARQAVAADPMEPRAQETLIEMQALSQDTVALLDECRRAAAECPDDFGAVYRLGVLLFKMEHVEESIEMLRRALELAPETYFIEFKIAQTLFESKKFVDVLSVISVMRRRGVDTAEVHELAGKVLLELKQPGDAARAYSRALERDADNYNHHAGLSQALFRTRRWDDAREVTRNFLRQFNAYTQPAKNPEAHVLVLSSVGSRNCYINAVLDKKQMFIMGNSPSQIPGGRNTYHYTCIQHPDMLAAARALGPIDVIINNMAGAEDSIKRGHGLNVREFVDMLGVPVVNAPEAVERTTRANNARIIPEHTDIIFPHTVLYDLSAEGPEKVKERILETVRFPMLIRRSHTNEDTDIAFAENEAELTAALNRYHKKNVEEIYAIEFHTQEFRPGISRKIRCAIIDNVFYPVRMDFSTHWNVRRKELDSATAKANQDLMDNEQAYLADPIAYLGPKNIARLETLGRLHDLDFLGVDFNILGDGKMFVFEANPAMNCIEKRRVEEFPYFADYWERVVVAFEDMIVKKAGNTGTEDFHR